MRILENMIEELEDEIEGAREYAEKYIDCKARGNIARATKYKEMAHDELRHFATIRDFAIADADGIKRVHTLTEHEVEWWEHNHKKLNDEVAMINHLLSM